MYHHSLRPKDGEYTKVVYNLIKEQKYAEVVKILTSELNMNGRSRAALSILGYCTYQMQHYEDSVVYYKRLVDLCPNNEHYLMYLAQSQYKACSYQDAMNTGNAAHIIDTHQTWHLMKMGCCPISAASLLTKKKLEIPLLA